MYREVTFSKPTERIGRAHAFDVDLFRLAELTAVLALCHRASLFLYFEEGTIGVFARGGAVSLDTGLTRYDEIRCANRMEPFVELTMRTSCSLRRPTTHDGEQHDRTTETQKLCIP